MSHHLVEAVNLSYRYPDGHLALDAVSFSITHGESVAVIGANGAGKSTLLQHLNGCLLPSSGEVRIGHLPVTRQSLDTVRRTVGMVFQNPDDQLFMPTVLEDVQFGPSNMGFAESAARMRAMEALQQVGAAHLVESAPYHLSGGEKKRVALATVLAMHPDILVLDEPSAGLDHAARRQVIELIRGFAHTKIMTTHDFELILDCCERVIVLDQGSLLLSGPTAEVFAQRELLARCGLEPPRQLRCQQCGTSVSS